MEWQKFIWFDGKCWSVLLSNSNQWICTDEENVIAQITFIDS